MYDSEISYTNPTLSYIPNYLKRERKSPLTLRYSFAQKRSGSLGNC